MTVIRRKSMFQMMEEMLAETAQLKTKITQQENTISELNNKFDQLIVSQNTILPEQ